MANVLSHTQRYGYAGVAPSQVHIPRRGLGGWLTSRRPVSGRSASAMPAEPVRVASQPGSPERWECGSPLPPAASAATP